MHPLRRTRPPLRHRRSVQVEWSIFRDDRSGSFHGPVESLVERADKLGALNPGHDGGPPSRPERDRTCGQTCRECNLTGEFAQFFPRHRYSPFALLARRTCASPAAWSGERSMALTRQSGPNPLRYKAGRSKPLPSSSANSTVSWHRPNDSLMSRPRARCSAILTSRTCHSTRSRWMGSTASWHAPERTAPTAKPGRRQGGQRAPEALWSLAGRESSQRCSSAMRRCAAHAMRASIKIASICAACVSRNHQGAKLPRTSAASVSPVRVRTMPAGLGLCIAPARRILMD